MSTVVPYSANTGATGDLSTTSDTFADVTGLTVTVLGTAVADQLVISAYMPSVTAGADSNVKYKLLVNGVSVTGSNSAVYAGIDGNTKLVYVEWALTLQSGDISGGNTIVKIQWAKYNAGSATCIMINGADGRGHLQVLHVRT